MIHVASSPSPSEQKNKQKRIKNKSYFAILTMAGKTLLSHSTAMNFLFINQRQKIKTIPYLYMNTAVERTITIKSLKLKH